jgi:hypothetical protein
MKTKLNFITKTLFLLFFVLTTSICFAQRKETISGTFFYLFYPNGQILQSTVANHTIPAHKGHIEVTLPPHVQMFIYQKNGDGTLSQVLLQNSGTDRSVSKKHIMSGSYGGPDYIIEMKYPLTEMINQTIVYNIDFYYYDTIYANDAEPNDTKETAISMSENTSYEGWGYSYESNNGQDYYKITAKKRGTYTISSVMHATNSGIPVNSRLNYKSNHYYTEEFEPGVKSTLKIYCVDKDEEIYFLTLNSANSYKLNYTVEESLDENDVEPNDTFESAIELSENNINTGTIGFGEITNLFPKDYEDFYKITPTKNGKLIVNFKEKIGVSGNNVYVYEKVANQNYLQQRDFKDLTDYNQTIEVDCASPNKTYYIKVNQKRFDNSYTSYLCCNAYEVSWNIQNTTNAGCGFLSTTDFENTGGLNIYPNPTTSILNIQSSDNAIIDSVTLFDLTGKIILQQTKSPNQINVESLTSGTYIIEVITGDKKRISKFVKE